MSYPVYERYKASGVAWLGDVPEGWGVIKGSLIGTLFGSEQVSEEFVCDDGELPFIKVSSLSLDSLEIKSWDWFIDRSVIKQYKSRNNYIAFPKRGAAIFLNKVNIVDKPSLIDPNLMGWEMSEKVMLKFMAYTIKSKKLEELADVSTVPQINNKHIGHESFPIPPLEEQHAIATFLDTKTAQIDTLIAKKEALLTLLAEKRTALITHAVTKGLNPDVKMKESGVAWLGDVPEGWGVKSIKWITSVKRGASPRPIENPIFFDDDGEFGWVRISDVTASEMYLRETEQQLSDIGSSLSVKIYPGQLFLSIAGSVGKPIIAGIKCCIHDGFVYFPEIIENSKFLYYVFLSGQPYLGLGKMGTQLNLNTDTVGGIIIGVPSLPEQQTIATFLDTKTTQIDATVAKIKAAIELLKEYRTALITNAVTGKIRVP